ncbi:MAG: helix-turn-helix transcriptional regulator [Anaerolineaceae bacterium]|nr:helix-turn-helix transcriptional regulator [Oscillospiraceae bacterium]MBQ6481563.1 helix-turn-helix transcriptional regulator [Anaerolineaceae bacterium]
MEEIAQKTKLLLKDMEQNIRRLIFSYMIIGRFPNDWSFEAYNDYLAARSVTLRCFIFWLDKMDADVLNRRQISTMIEEKYPYVCARVYDTFIVCLSFDRADRPEIRSDGIKEIILSETAYPFIQCFESEPLTDLWQMVSTYHALCATAEKTTVPDRGGRTIRLYALEREVLDDTIEYESDSIRAALEEIARLIDRINRHDWIKDQSYFCFLWRYIDRGIFQRCGKRASIEEKNSIDQELQSAEGLDDAVNILCGFIEADARAVGLLNSNNKSSSYHRIIEMAKQYIIENCAGDVSLERVAREVGFSSFYLSKLFKKEEGVNYKDYVISVRMEKAKQLILEGRLNVSEVAVAVGYNNNTYFGKAFKNYFNVTAKDMRLYRRSRE